METKYTINYWYDSVDPNNINSFVLTDSDTFTGIVGTTIEEVDDIMSGFYFRRSDNLPLTLSNDETQNVINIYYTKLFREYMYQLARQSLSNELVTADIDVFLKLIGVIYGDIYTIARNIDDAINIDYIDEEHLRHLCKLIGYTWVEALTADEQRESIKFYMYLRRMRGTKFGLKNLIRIFGQTATSLYQASNNVGVRIFEYQEGNKYGLFPGDIRIEIPEMSRILRNAAEDVKLMGTRLRFAYRIDIGSTNKDIYGHMLGYYPAPGVTGNIRMWIQPGLKGWDTPIDIDEDKENSQKFIYKYRDTFNIHGSTDAITYPVIPYTEMWMFQVAGLENVRGHVLDDGIIDETLYLYK